MPWARAVIHGGLGAALLDFWQLSDMQTTALAMARRGELTDAEQAEEERRAQQKLAAELTAAFGRPKR